MLGRFSNALQQAADVLAPPPPLFEDFVYYWKKLMNHYLDVSKTKLVPIELTNIPNHLDHLLQILLKEEKEAEGVGACLEYLLQHNLLDLLATLAGSDDPPGMKQHVLQFVSKLLNQSKSMTIGHLSIYFALQRLVCLCDGTTPTATESYEVQFLLSVSGILRRNPQLVSVFITNAQSGECSSSTTTPGRRGSCGSSSGGSDSSGPPRNALFTTPLLPSARASEVTLIPQQHSELPPLPSPSSDDSQSQFPLADAVLSYLDSPDTGVRLKACQALMLIVSLPDEVRTSSMISKETSLRLISRLVLLYYTIPHTTEPSHIDDMHLSWGLDIPSNDCLTCRGCKQAAIFLSWFDFCDKVMVEGHVVIAIAVARRLLESFLGQVFTVTTLEKPITLTILTKCFKMATSPDLKNVLYEWLICDEVLKTILGNWMSQNSDLAIETIRFFELILEKGSARILHPLILNYINDRSYLIMSTNGSEEKNSFSKTAEIRKPDVSYIIESPEDHWRVLLIDRTPTISPSVHPHGQLLLHLLLNESFSLQQKWTNVLPKEVQSCTCGYEEYIGESMRQYQSVLTKASPFSPLSENPTSAEFQEGPFLSTLLTALSNISKQPYELNLELTGIVSKLALRPEPAVTEYLLTSTETLVGRTLYSVLRAVAAELASTVSQVPNYLETLKEVRSDLLGRSSSVEELRNGPWISAFESIVVVEELCKELAAIAHVKLKANNT